MTPKRTTAARVRLQKFLSEAGVASRRRAEELIEAGRVLVNDTIVDHLPAFVDPASDHVVVDGTPARTQPLDYFLVHKPKGVVCTNRDPAGRPRATDLLPPTKARLNVVGRLDADSTGLLLMTNDGELLDYLEVIGRGKTLVRPPAPYVAVPTSAGTGAEVTRNAVLASPEHKVKVSLRSPLMLPRLALIDPELTHSLPPGVTASTGLDALTQVLEPYVSHRANPLTDSLCREGMARAARSLRRAYEDGADAAHLAVRLVRDVDEGVHDVPSATAPPLYTPGVAAAGGSSWSGRQRVRQVFLAAGKGA